MFINLGVCIQFTQSLSCFKDKMYEEFNCKMHLLSLCQFMIFMIEAAEKLSNNSWVHTVLLILKIRSKT